MIVLLALAAVLVAAPIAAALLVSLASLREDARHSLSGKAPSWIAGAARRLLSVPSPGASRGRARRQRPRPYDDPGAQVPRPRVPDDHETSGWLTGPKA
jgi:hypothetical protein